MHPAYSIIVFTTLSGLGYGLAAILGLGPLDPAAAATKVAHLLALTLIGAGLLSSTLHLGNPQRAWRALSQWRSSWLSREGVLSILAFVPLVASAWLCLFEDRYVAPVGIAGSILSALTVYSTSMIYASLRSVEAWNTPMTSACYLLFSAAGGLLLACMFAAFSASLSLFAILAAVVALIAAWQVRLMWRNRMRRQAPLSTPESATGLGHIGKVRLLERPHFTDNYLTREMGYRVARKHADKLTLIAIGLGGALPVALLLAAAAIAGPPLAVAAFLVIAVLAHLAGMLAERWLFFAEARHAVSNYYGI
jgi:DMSO reductase anchor subunit